jgi:predicted 3-demethylubiquinone-9 3-methyltransferase (glyoxalase superfamily)
MQNISMITPCLWFDDQAEAAAEFYTAIFSNSKIINMTRYGEAGHEIHGKPIGTVMTVAFELNGQTFTALNGGSTFAEKSQQVMTALLQMKKLDIEELKRATVG